ncbi:MAG: RsmD family RNA methyltransferase, partial [Desulfovibrionaceae bacterium]|nr:RsmD family RNA methyltransferase [Desulfovibrionaceae bacterium]
MRIISGKFGGRTVRTCPGEGMRPATGRLRSALFSMLEAREVQWSGLLALDLFAGSGSLGFEC